MRTIGIHQLMQTKFHRLGFEGEWKKTVGDPEMGFSCLIYGTSGNGKTTAIVRFIKYLCSFGFRAGYLSHEEGISGTMQDAFRAANMMEVSGSVVLCEDATFDETVTYFAKRGSPEIMVIDSVDYCDLTKAQYQFLRKKFPKKIIIMIAWSKGNKPKTQAAQDIEYMVDMKLFVKNFMIWPKSRFGGNIPYVIWEERARLLEQRYFLDLDKAAKKNLFDEPKEAEIVAEEGGVSA